MAGVKTFVYPCDTISKIASVATNEDICEYIYDILNDCGSILLIIAIA